MAAGLAFTIARGVRSEVCRRIGTWNFPARSPGGPGKREQTGTARPGRAVGMQRRECGLTAPPASFSPGLGEAEKER